MSSLQPHPTDRIDSAAPFLKWAGGKSQLLEQYAPLFPKEKPQRYFEPFVGSGAVFFYLRRGDFAQEYRLYDVNPELITVYRVVRDQVDDLIELLKEHKQQHDADSKQHFYRIRNQDRDPGWLQTASDVARAARLIYLNKTCFNGLWRVNSKGHFNVPLGRYRNPAILDEDRLRAASAALQGVQIEVRDFRDIVAEARPGDFVYFDPPYVPLSATAHFTAYVLNSFGEVDQRALADVFRRLDAKGCMVMLSNADAPLVHDLYAGYRLLTVQARRAINTRADRRGPISEIVALNFGG